MLFFSGPINILPHPFNGPRGYDERPDEQLRREQDGGGRGAVGEDRGVLPREGGRERRGGRRADPGDERLQVVSHDVCYYEDES